MINHISNNISIFYLFLLLVSTIFTSYFTIIINRLSFKFNILDFPSDRKIHDKPIPVSGGIIIIFITSIYLILSLLLDIQDKMFFLDVYLYSLIFFVFGLIDDLKNLNTKLKLLLIIFFLLLISLFDQSYNLEFLSFSYIFNKTFVLEAMSIPFTIFCILMLFNALNYADGDNGIAISLSIYWIIFLCIKFNIYNFFIINIIIVLLIVLIFNVRNKLFLGNSGVNFLSVFIGLNLIKFYNLNYFNEIDRVSFYCDEIFLLLFIPGIDATRVTILRVINKKSPIQPDKEHFHHYLSSYVKKKYIWIVYLLVTMLPLLLLYFSKNFYLSIILAGLTYFSLIGLRKLLSSYNKIT
tara:strand:- start:840 stop:1895 length:1056 start_codon:yes stop_codon:yes gene_type:complete